MGGLDEWRIARQLGFEEAEREMQEAAAEAGSGAEADPDAGQCEAELPVDLPEKARLLEARAAVSRALDGDSTCVVLPPAEQSDSGTPKYDL